MVARCPTVAVMGDASSALEQESRSGAIAAPLREASFTGIGGDPVSALLATPSSDPAGAGILYLHWGFGDRKSFAREAEAYAGVGATALCMDAPGFGARKGSRVGSKDPALVRAYAERLLGDLSLALAFLRAQPGVDPDRIAYVGHSLGASIGGAFLAREPGVRAAALMAGTGRLSRLWLQRRDPASSGALEDLDTEACLPRVHASLLFQFAALDAWIKRVDADAQVSAAREPKRALWYACDHALDASAAADRARWLAAELALPRVPELPAGELLPRAQVRACRVVAPIARVASWLLRRA